MSASEGHALAPAVRRIEELEREIDEGRKAARYYVSEISRKDHVITAAEGRVKQLEEALERIGRLDSESSHLSAPRIARAALALIRTKEKQEA